MSKTALLLAAAFGALSIFSFAQEPKPAAPAEPPRPQMTPEQRVQRMKETLNLSDEQVAKILDIFKRTQDKLKEIRDNAALAEEDRRAKSAEVFKEIQQEMTKVLSPEQLAKWKEEIKKRRAQAPK